jgi:hypothetical protein
VLFSTIDNIPLLSMDAERAARRIVLAMKRGESEVTLTLPAKIGARMNGIFPGLTSQVLGVANRLLPATAEPGMKRGFDMQQALGSSLHERVTAMGLDAARRLNEIAPAAADPN